MRKLTPEQENAVRALRAEGMKYEWLALEFGVSMWTIGRIVKEVRSEQS
jgi:DNA invertase Pin-like site-specific DNA recombinase